MTHWYYADAAGQQQGPVDAEQLRQLHAEGRLGPDSLVWRDGLLEWQPLSWVAEELGIALAVPTPAPADAPAGEPLAAATPLAATVPAESTPVAARPAAAVVSAGQVVLAGFWRRFAANIIDSLILGVGMMPVTVPAGMAMGIFSESGDGTSALMGALLFQLAIQVFALVVTAIYFGCFHASRLMASPGKLAVGIKVVRPDGARLTYGRSFGRGLAYYLSFLTLYIGFLMAAFTQRKQALHDIICDTLVVDRWAFTDTPERQRQGLDTVTLVILIVYGVFVLAVLAVLAIAVAVGLAAGAH